MRLAAITYGTDGDTRPLAALCRALLDAGHEVRLLAADETVASATALGVPITPLHGRIKVALKGGGSVGALVQIVKANTEAWLAAAVSAAAGCDAIIVSGLAAFVGLSAAEHLGLPAVGTGLIPITPTAAFPSPFVPPSVTPAWLNRPSHEMINALIWTSLRRATNAARARVCGLPPRRRLWTKHPMLYGVSPSLVPAPADWPESARVCGQWASPPAIWTPPRDLARFLAQGEPPIYIGFGSMMPADPQGFLAALVAAVGDRRALFYPGWSGVEARTLPPNLHVIGETPHGWLFPQVSVAIHHGGSGTTHSAARAGVPSVVAPFAGDQAFWADRLRRLGVAPPPVSQSALRRGGLARAIAAADDPAVRARASALAARMAKEDGLATAVAAIEDFAKGSYASSAGWSG